MTHSANKDQVVRIDGGGTTSAKVREMAILYQCGGGPQASFAKSLRHLAEIGAELLRFWEFPESLIEAIRFQLNPTRCENAPKLACLLALARWVRNRICAETGWGDHEPPDPFHMKLAALEEEELNQICVVAEERLDAAESLAASW